MRFTLLHILFLFLLSWQWVTAQHDKYPIQLSGIIRDENNQPVQFATVVVPNRYKGTISDQRGMFSFIVYPNDSVRFSSVGFKTQFLVIPQNLDRIHYSVDIRMVYDTIQLAEVQIFRFGTYEEFREALINLRLPEDDYHRAMANIALIKAQINSDTGADPASNYKYFMQQQHHRAMYRGQIPQQNIFNPFAWAQFIQAIREGRFRR